MEDSKLKLHDGIELDEFWRILGAGAEEALMEIEVEGRKGSTKVLVPGVGPVEVWLDECSEGADRGGYVKWYELANVLDLKGKPLQLEADTDDCEIFFAGRMGRFYS